MKPRTLIWILLVGMVLSSCSSADNKNDVSGSSGAADAGSEASAASDADSDAAPDVAPYTDEEIAGQITLINQVEARVDEYLLSHPAPTAEELAGVVEGSPGLASSGPARNTSAWGQLGANGPIVIFMVNPVPYGSDPGVEPTSEATLRNTASDNRKYALYQTSFGGSFDRNPEIAALLNSKGYQRVGAQASVEELRTMQNVKLLHIHTHGGVGSLGPSKEEQFWMVTASPAPEVPSTLLPEATRADLAAGRIYWLVVKEYSREGWWIPTSQTVRRFAINKEFVRTYLSFADDSFFFMSSCYGGADGASSWREALFNKNLSVYGGWDEETDVSSMGKSSVFFYDRLLGTNSIAPIPDPPQRPFDYDSVYGEMRKNGLDTAVFNQSNGPAITSKFHIFKNPNLGARKPVLVPTIKTVTVEERDKSARIAGVFPPDPGTDRRKVTLKDQPIVVKENGWKEDSIEVELPADTCGDVAVIADEHESNAVQLTEWSLTFTQSGTTTIQEVGETQGTATFKIKFRGDVHEFRPEAGDEPMSLVLVPFSMQEAGTLTWTVTGTALGQPANDSGSTANRIDIDFTNPGWVFDLPDGDHLAGEGYFDLTAHKLYLFLLGHGDNSGYGTFNLGPTTNCVFHHDTTTNRVYLVFDLDDQFNIVDGSCDDKIEDSEGGMVTTSTRTWHFETTNPPKEDAHR